MRIALTVLFLIIFTALSLAQTIPPPPAESVVDTAPIANAPLLERLKDLQAKYTAVRAEKDKSARMLLWAGGIAAALKFLLDLLGRFAGGKSWMALVALGMAVPIGLLSHFAGGHGWFDSILVAGAGPGAVFVHEIVKRLAPTKKLTEASA